ncbi:MAG: hypothetical protein ACFBSF_00825 [Leptolyngbyaceae cyanobacterium]
MKLSPPLLTLSSLALSISLGPAAKAADNLALSFDLEPVRDTDSVDAPVAVAAPTAVVSSHLADAVEQEAPLSVPAAAANPPFAGDKTFPAGVYGGGQALALSNSPPARTALPAPPPVSVATLEPQQQSAASKLSEQTAPTPKRPTPVEVIDNILLGFDLAPRSQPSQPVSTSKPATSGTAEMISRIFQGGVESLVARAVGSAEGTRTPEGHKTQAYFGHIDPGNGVWNLGTFSYQHTAHTPEEADTKQLTRLQSQSLALKQKALAHNLTLSLEELLNGIDLANQAPQAALDREGYIEWLAKARRQGITGPDAIIWARTQSFIDPDTQRWNAPGLGNNVDSIANDQSRRVNAIARAVDVEVQSAGPRADVSAETSEVAVSESLSAIDDVLFQTVGVLPINTTTVTPPPSTAVSRDQQPDEATTAKPVSFPLDDELPITVDESDQQVVTERTSPANPIATSDPKDTSRIAPVPSEFSPSSEPLSSSSGDEPTQTGVTTDSTERMRESPSLAEAFATPNIDVPGDPAADSASPADDPFPRPNIDFPHYSDKIRPKGQ